MDNTKCKVCKKHSKPLVADLWEGYIHEQGFMRPHLCLRHDLHLKQVGGGHVNLLTTELTTTVNAGASPEKRAKHRFALHLSLLILLRSKCKRVVCEHTAKQTTEFGLGEEKTYSILDQPGMPDEEFHLLAQQLMK